MQRYSDIQKAGSGPGSRGGKFYYDRSRTIRYGDKPQEKQAKPKARKMRLNKTAVKLLSEKHGTHYGNFNTTQHRMFEKLKDAGLIEMRNSSAYATEAGKAALAAHSAKAAEKTRAAEHGSVKAPTTEGGHKLHSTASGTEIGPHRESHRANMPSGLSVDQHYDLSQAYSKLTKDPKLNTEQKAKAEAAHQVHRDTAGQMAHEARTKKSLPRYSDIQKARK